MPRFTEELPNPRSWAPIRLDSNGDGSGATSAVGNYSDAGLGPTYFYVRSDYRELKLSGLTIKVRDGGPITADGYGAMLQLTNGVQLHIRDEQDNVIVDFTAGEPITSNGDWFDFTTNVVISEFGAGDNFIGVGFRAPSPLYLPVGWSLGYRFHDDMTGLIRQAMFAFGRYVRGFG